MFTPLANQYKFPGIEYTSQEQSRVSICGQEPRWLDLRHGHLCRYVPGCDVRGGWFAMAWRFVEGQLRRGHAAADIGRRYRSLVEKMLSDLERLPRYEIFRFEDLLHNTDECVASLYRHCGLDIRQLRAIRMQVRRAMDSQGNHRLTGDKEWDVEWYDLDRLDAYFHQDVNQNQIRRLEDADRTAFLREAGSAMEKLGYSVELPTSNEPVIYSFRAKAPQKRQLEVSGQHRKVA